MILDDMFDKYVEFKILNYFMDNPTTPLYVNDISRKLKVSSGSVSTFVNKAAKNNLLIKKVVGNTHLYRLNNDLPIVRNFKISSFLINIEKINLIQEFLKLDDSIISIVIYGSYANGTYDEKSDVDIIIISDKKTNLQSVLQASENKLKKTINVEIFNLAEWKKISKENRAFYNSVIKSNIVLYGGELV